MPCLERADRQSRKRLRDSEKAYRTLGMISGAGRAAECDELVGRKVQIQIPEVVLARARMEMGRFMLCKACKGSLV